MSWCFFISDATSNVQHHVLAENVSKTYLAKYAKSTTGVLSVNRYAMITVRMQLIPLHQPVIGMETACLAV